MEDKTPNEKQPLTLPFLITKGLVVYPNMNEAVDAGRPYSMEAIRQAKANSNSLLFVGCQKEADKDDIKIPDDVFETATLCRIVYSNEKDDSIKVRLIGSRRVLLSNIRFEKGSYIADGSILEDEEGDEFDECESSGVREDLPSGETPELVVPSVEHTRSVYKKSPMKKKQ